jgi:hypothetical protein
MELSVICPYCRDANVESVPDAKLYAENLPQQTTPIAASVFRCNHWHVFAAFPLDGEIAGHPKIILGSDGATSTIHGANEQQFAEQACRLLAEISQLLEEYAPPWYSQGLRDRLRAAMRGSERNTRPTDLTHRSDGKSGVSKGYK